MYDGGDGNKDGDDDWSNEGGTWDSLHASRDVKGWTWGRGSDLEVEEAALLACCLEQTCDHVLEV
jgi:hypothetical protein